jgi:hypothetical protein
LFEAGTDSGQRSNYIMECTLKMQVLAVADELRYCSQIKGPYSFDYGYTADLVLPPMGTAIVSAYTPKGFVIGADGLRREGRTGAVVSESVTKIFSAKAHSSVSAYAWAGVTSLFGPGGESCFDLLGESAVVERIMASFPTGSFIEYVSCFMEMVYERLLVTNGGDKLTGGLDQLPEGEQIARTVFVSYFMGVPWRATFEIFRRNDVLGGVRLMELRPAPGDFQVFSGSNMIFNRFRPRLRRPDTLEEAIALVRDYIQSCIDNRGHDKECEDIGGHIHIAALTPDGFRWVIAPR